VIDREEGEKMKVKSLISKRVLLVCTAFTLSIPTAALGKEATSGKNQSINVMEKSDAIKISTSLDNFLKPYGDLTPATKVINNAPTFKESSSIKTTKKRDKLVATAMQFVQFMQTGHYEDAIHSSSYALQKVLSPQQLEVFWSTLPQQLNAGPFLYVGEAELIESNTIHSNVEIQLVFEKGMVPIIIRMNRFGKVDDFFVNPSTGPVAKAPFYSDPDLFTEKEVVIGKGAFALPGTLSIPKGKGPFPVVVLVHGSGPLDKDETAFALKPFRDLAHGLASKGIAVLRYNKRTFEHTVKTSTDLNHTVDKETTDDALLATRFLKKESKIDKNRIYILGHSQGGMMVPQIINKDTKHNIAGAIVMAGPARTIQDVVLDQFEYLLSIGQLTPENYEYLKAQFEMLNDPNFSSENPPPGFQLGPAMFWDSFRKIKAAEMAASQTTPLLILQGERDYQVLSHIEIPLWKQHLAKRNNVSYHIYPKLNHFFTEGEGEKSRPDEYFVPANIPEYVIKDITNWIQSNPK
jgi:uncharacterized protein